MWSGALDSSSVLLSYPVISLASHKTIILISNIYPLSSSNIHFYLIQALVIPKAELNGGPFDPTDLTSKKTFKHFPHYKTQGADIDFDAANLLSDLAGWTIQQNKDMFNDIVQNW